MIKIVFLSFGLIVFGCASKTIVTNCQDQSEPSGRLIGSIHISEEDCIDKKKPDHKYTLEIIKLRENGFVTFMIGGIEHHYLIKPPIGSKMIFDISLPPGRYILSRLYVGNFMPLGIPFNIRFDIKDKKVLILGHIDTQFPCWVTGGAKVSYSLQEFDLGDLQSLKDSCKVR